VDAMIRSKTGMMIALLFPILALLALTVYKRHILMSGQEVVLPISGYDPRDLLSGHYLTYKIEYGVNNLCLGATNRQQAYVCLSSKTFSLVRPEKCQLFIRGICQHGEFSAGIEKYYIPENQAAYLEKEVLAKTASIIISVTSNGHVQVKDLLLNGQSWHRK
jgi:uncharacterized membrane-anchored protein